MAQRRMFSLQIVDTDAFLDMPQSSQLLYFHLSMRADDDGFVGNPKKIIRMCGAGEDDMKVLIAKRFVLNFESVVVVIKHWKIHNYIQNDRYHETKYLEEKSGLITKENGAYTEVIQDVSKLDTEVRLELGKVSLGKDRVSTPSQINRDFFEEGEIYKSLYEEYVVKINPAIVEREFKKFILYWTELNATGKKERWEQQATFDVKRRLYKWFSGIAEHKQFNRPSGINKRGVIL